MRTKILSILILLPIIGHASPWDSGNFLGSGDGLDRLLYWLVSGVVMLVFLAAHFIVVRLSVVLGG